MKTSRLAGGRCMSRPRTCSPTSDTLGAADPDADLEALRFERTEEHHAAAAALFRKVITEAFVPDLAAPDRPFRPGLRVKGVAAHPGVFEMTWDNDGRATFSYGEERVPGQPHVIWRRIGTHAVLTPPPGP